MFEYESALEIEEVNQLLCTILVRHNKKHPKKHDIPPHACALLV